MRKEISTKRDYKKRTIEILNQKNTVTTRKFTRWFNSKLDSADERISEFEDKSFEIMQLEEQKERMKRSEESLNDL